MSEYIIDFDTELGIDTLTNGDLREEIVRCRDCKWLIETDNPISSTGWWCVQNDTPRSPDGFCDWGERRDA